MTNPELNNISAYEMASARAQMEFDGLSMLASNNQGRAFMKKDENGNCIYTVNRFPNTCSFETPGFCPSTSEEDSWPQFEQEILRSIAMYRARAEDMNENLESEVLPLPMGKEVSLMGTA